MLTTALNEHGTLTITLDRPARGNRLDQALVEAFAATLDELETNSAVRAVVVAGSGMDFCLGDDFEFVVPADDAYRRRAACLASNDLMMALAACTRPTVAKVQGRAHGVALELIAACDLALAAHSATFACPGLESDSWPHTAQVGLSRLTTRKFAMHMIMTGVSVTAGEALQAGLVSQVVDADKLTTTVDALTARLATCDAEVIRRGKYSYDHQATMNRGNAYEFVSEQYLNEWLGAKR